MKKILFSALLFSMSIGLFAQFTKGSIAFTGTAGLGGNKQINEQTNSGMTVTTTDQKTRQFVFLPGVSYFITDKIEGGIALLVSKNTTTNNYAAPNPTKEIKNENPFSGVGLFGNYYFKTAEKFAMYGGLQFGILSGKGKVTTTPYSGSTTVVETKNNGSTLGLNTGFLYFVKSNIALNASLGILSFNKYKTESTNNNTTFKTKNSNWALGVNGVIINIGVKIFLNKKTG